MYKPYFICQCGHEQTALFGDPAFLGKYCPACHMKTNIVRIEVKRWVSHFSIWNPSTWLRPAGHWEHP